MCFMKYLMELNALYLYDNELFSIHMQATFWWKKLLFFQHYLLSVFYHATKEDVQQEMKIDGLFCWLSVNSLQESLIVLLIKLIF